MNIQEYKADSNSNFPVDNQHLDDEKHMTDVVFDDKELQKYCDSNGYIIGGSTIDTQNPKYNSLRDLIK